MQHLVEEDESAGWKTFRIHSSSVWRTSRLLRVCRSPKISFVPQTELAMRGSYGVAKEGGYDSSVDPVALPRSILYCNLHDLVTPTLKNTS